MTLDEMLKDLLEKMETPKTVEDALQLIKSDPVCQATLEELAFKQTVTNILIAAGLVSEADFNQSANYFKDMFARQYAENLIKRLQELKGEPAEPQSQGIWVRINDDPVEDKPLEDDDWPDDKIGKA